MIAKNKIHQKKNKPKLKSALIELKQVMNRTGINTLQKLMLYKRLSEYRMQSKESNVNEKENQNERGNNIINIEANMLSKRIKELESEIASMNDNTNIKNGANINENNMNIKNINDNIDDNTNIDELASLNNILEKTNTKLEKENEEIKIERINLEQEIKIIKETSRLEIEQKIRRIEQLEKEIKEIPKQEDVIEALTKITNLNNEIQKYRERILRLNKEVALAGKKIRNLQEEIKDKERISNMIIEEDKTSTANTVEKMLGEELNRMIGAFNRSVETIRYLEKRIEILGRKNEELYDESAKIKNKIKIEEESRQIQEKEKKENERIKKEIKEMKEEITRKLEKIEEEEGGKNEEIKKYKERNEEMECKIEQIKREDVCLKKRVAVLNEELVRRRVEIVEKQQQINKRDERIKWLRKRCGVEEDTEEEIEIYRGIIRCGLCASNLKDCVLTTCMHCFCEGCIKNRFKARNRSCPTCGKSFTMADVKKLYL